VFLSEGGKGGGIRRRTRDHRHSVNAMRQPRIKHISFASRPFPRRESVAGPGTGKLLPGVGELVGPGALEFREIDKRAPNQS
jgi:hypothetical protein